LSASCRLQVFTYISLKEKESQQHREEEPKDMQNFFVLPALVFMRIVL